MIDLLFRFLTDELNRYLAGRGIQPPCKAIVSRIVDDEGHVALPGHSVGVYLVNASERQTLRSEPTREPAREPTALGLDLAVLFAVNGRDYHQALSVLGHVITFFHEHPVFDAGHAPGLDARLGRVSVDIEALTLEQLHQLWRTIGCRQMPAVLARVRVGV